MKVRAVIRKPGRKFAIIYPEVTMVYLGPSLSKRMSRYLLICFLYFNKYLQTQMFL